MLRIGEKGVEPLRELPHGPRGNRREERAGERDEGECVAGGRRVEHDEIDSGLARGRSLSPQDVPDLAEEEEIREAGRRPREEPEGRHGEEAVGEQPDGREGVDEVGQKRVEVGREAVEAGGELGLAVARILLPEESRRVPAPIRGDEQDGATGVRRELRERGRDRGFPDAALARHDEEPAGNEAFEEGCRAHGAAYARRCPSGRIMRDSSRRLPDPKPPRKVIACPNPCSISSGPEARAFSPRFPTTSWRTRPSSSS